MYNVAVIHGTPNFKMYYMTKSERPFPRSKVRSRPDGGTLTASIPQPIAHAMRLQAGDSIEWIWITEGYQSYCKVIRIQNLSHSKLV
jgi:hypothetical protein